MINSKKWIAGCSFAIALCLSPLTALASSPYTTPADAVAGITGKTVDEVLKERLDGKTYEQIAEDADKLKEFQDAMLQMKQDALDLQVTNGQLTQEAADTFIETLQSQDFFCDGSGNCYENGIGQACTGTGLCLGNNCHNTASGSTSYTYRHHNGNIGKHHNSYNSYQSTTTQTTSDNRHHNRSGHHGNGHH